MRNLPNRLTMRKQEVPQSSNGLRFLKNKASNTTDIYVYEEIGFWGVTAQDFVNQLREVDTKKINLHLNSPGGEIFDGQAIYNALKQHDASVTVYIDALAASAASFIAMAGDEIIAARNATLMIHDGMGMTFGNAADMRDMADLLDKLSDTIADMYAQKAGGTVEEWRALMKEEVWYNSFEAREAGLVDVVLDAEDEEAEAETNKWDLSLFNYEGRSKAPSPAEIRKRVLNVKESNLMGTRTSVVNHDESQQQTDPPSNPPAQPQQEPGDSPQETQETAPEEETQQVPPAEQTGHTPDAPSNRAGFTVLVNGAPTNDLGAVQSHINALERFRNEAIEQGRRDFVSNLSDRNIIPATQVEGLTNHVLSLNDEQFSAFAALYENAQPQSMFQPHGVTPGDSNSPTNTTRESLQDEINTLEQIVADHRRSGMSEDKIKSKASYTRLQELKSQLNQN